MARLNLLPWREEARRERQRQFLYSLMGTLVLGAVLGAPALAGTVDLKTC